MTFKEVEAEGARLGHVVAVKGDAWPVRAALCGYNPFPGSWEQPLLGTKPLCRTCIAEVRRRRT